MTRQEWENLKMYHKLKANNMSLIRFLRALKESKKNEKVLSNLALDISEIKEKLQILTED